jgi:hypothetical protein
LPKSAEKLLKLWARDLSTLTAEEIRAKWGRSECEALNHALQRARQPLFEDQLVNHNPIYFLAERLYFDNVADQPEFLYPPLHRDGLSASLLEYLLSPVGQYSGHLTIIQRDSFKSTFHHGVGPWFVALRAWNTGKVLPRQLLCHQKEPQASANLMRMKDKARFHRWLRATWPEFCTTEDFGTKLKFNFPCRPENLGYSEHNIHAGGIQADYTGLHFDHVWFSDLENEDHINSKVVRDDVRQKYDSLMYIVDMKSGKKIHDGTPYHINGLWMRFQRDKKLHMFWQGAHLDDGTLSHPHRHSEEVLKAIQQKELDTSGTDDLYWLQMECKPKHSRVIATDPAWIQFIDPQEISPESWRVITVDPAWKGTKNAGEGDSASIQVWGLEYREEGFINSKNPLRRLP